MKQPEGDSWAEWRTWAVVNLLAATGVRASTVVNIKISDVDFEHNLIRLRKLMYIFTVLPDRFAKDPKAEIEDLLPWNAKIKEHYKLGV